MTQVYFRCSNPREVLVDRCGAAVDYLAEVRDHAACVQGDLSSVCVDRTQLEAALLNLVINARDAMPNGGKITVAAAEEIVLPGSKDDACVKRRVHLSVNDTGSGMSEMVLRRAAEPFFSTKEIGKGTGLGLSLACAVTRQLGGHFSIASQVGVGTTIDLWLPVPDG
jgi:signal transduction histidine kinase